jgi:hypothetical protein
MDRGSQASHTHQRAARLEATDRLGVEDVLEALKQSAAVNCRAPRADHEGSMEAIDVHRDEQSPRQACLR